MNCFNEGQLQSYLDGEVSFAERREIDKHLETCKSCQTNVFQLKENKDLVTACLGALGAEAAESRVNTRAAWSKFSLSYGGMLKSSVQNKGGIGLTNRFKNLAVAVSAMLVIGLTFSSSTVRAAASDFLTLFRVEKFQTISVNPQELENLEKVFREKGISMNIDNFGKVTNNGIEQPSEISLEEAKKLAGFKLLTPGYMPLEKPSARVGYHKSGSIEFQLNVQNVNNLITSLGGSDLLPADLDNKNFSVNVPDAFTQIYVLPGDERESRLSLTQFRGPEVTAPAGVDAEAIRKAILALPVIPEDIRRQLASIKDWRNTMVIPTEAGRTQEVEIGSITALYTAPRISGDHPAVQQSGVLVWETNGVITILEGSFSKDELVKVAENLQ